MSEDNPIRELVGRDLGWSILELMGHRKLAGYVTEVEIAGKGLLRVDVPASDDAEASTHYFSPEALYCLTPTTERMVQLVARSVRPEPVSRWEFPQAPKQLSAATETSEDEDFEEGLDDA